MSDVTSAPAATQTVLMPASGHSTAASIDELRAENARLRQALQLRNCALDAASSGFLIIDMLRPGRPIVYANRALTQRTGYTLEELIGAPSSILTPREPNEERVLQVRDAMKEGREIKIELQTARKDGSLYWSGMSLAPVIDDRFVVTHYVSMSADITARLEAERKRQELQDKLAAETKERERVEAELRLSQKLEAVGRLAAGISHEINTPIQYIGDSVMFLRSAREDGHGVLNAYRQAVTDLEAGAPIEDVKAAIRAAEQAGDVEFYRVEVPKAFERTLEGVERVAQIVRAMKEFSHPDAVDHEPADINHALETTLVVARNEYKYVATIETHLEELPPVMCNIGELNQVFLNLLVNSAHAIEETGKDVSTGHIMVTTAVDGEYVKITVRDNGCGIPQRNIDKVFDPFFTTKEVGKGTGQGLAITRSIIVDKHRGSVDIDTIVGAGTQFTLRLPIAGNGAGHNPPEGIV
jgi:two-component system NtrC family sensor kinase